MALASPPHSISLFSKPLNGGARSRRLSFPASGFRASSSSSSSSSSPWSSSPWDVPVPDFLSSDWYYRPLRPSRDGFLVGFVGSEAFVSMARQNADQIISLGMCFLRGLESRKKRPLGPRLNFSAEEAVQWQLDALKYNDKPRQDYGIEVMYRFAGFDPFERSTYFGPFFDLGQFERFRRIFHHSKYRVLLCHKERKILSSFWVAENCFKQRVWIQGLRPEEEEIFEFTMVQIGGSWDGYWLTESLLHDGDGFSGGIAY